MRDKVTTGFRLLGLAMTLSLCMWVGTIIALWVSDLSSFDKNLATVWFAVCLVFLLCTSGNLWHRIYGKSESATTPGNPPQATGKPTP